MNCVIVMFAHFVFSWVLINLDKYFILNINHLSVSVGCNNNPAIFLCCIHDIFNHINVVKISLCGVLGGIHKCTYGVIYMRAWIQVYAHTYGGQSSISATILEKRYPFVAGRTSSSQGIYSASLGHRR